MRKKMEKMELLNSEGPILIAEKKVIYVIRDGSGKKITELAESEMHDFVHGDLKISGPDNKSFRYSEFPGSMKPDLKKLDEFIGIDTAGKTY
jgi:hypothetical protein